MQIRRKIKRKRRNNLKKKIQRNLHQEKILLVTFLVTQIQNLIQ